MGPWLGCSKIASGCTSCYAEAMAGRLGVKWGPNGTRRRTSESTWKQVEAWNRKAEAGQCPDCKGKGHLGEMTDDKQGYYVCDQCGGTGNIGPHRRRVFPSLCDPFEDWSGPILNANGRPIYIPLCDHPDPRDAADHRQLTMTDIRRDFFALIDRCPNLDFLLLTKRPENIRSMWEGVLWCETVADLNYARDVIRHDPFPQRKNVWLLFSASDQMSLEAGWPHLMKCTGLSPVLGLSLEPLLGPITLPSIGFTGPQTMPDFIIVGGESGPHFRPMEVEWVQSIADQCRAAGVPLYVKQDAGRKPGQQGRIPDELWATKELP